ncbi:MAG: hypothetical protein ABI893_09545 [Polaromonas sp.]|uniref:hypothetical protein n=1 Tax=Polaromonas sp. TaxID=1869339 RepID=UPI003267185E
MRAVFSIVSLLVVLAAVGLLVKKQLGSQVASPSAAGMPAAPGGATPQEQSRQVQQQVKQSVESMMQQPRPLPDDK